jgi:hypothetical protein
MDDVLTRLWHEITARPDGPLAIRFYLQPLMATLFAVRDGVKDAQFGRPPYFWSLFTDPINRRERLRDGWQSVGKIFMLAILLDLLYEVTVLGGIRPVQGLIVAVVLAIIPYVLMRGPVNRLARRWRGGTTRAGGVG